MFYMFCKSQFNGDISNWNTLKVENMSSMFERARFKGDILSWNPYCLEQVAYIFLDCAAPVPYWAKIENNQDRVIAIDAYNQQIQLNQVLKKVGNNRVIVKI